MQFCGLGYTRPGTGETSDNWMPGLATPTYFPLLEERLRDAFAPVGLMIQYWQRKEGAGAQRDINVFVMNDKPAPWSGTITLKIMADTTVFVLISDTVTNVPTGYRSVKSFNITFSTSSGTYKLIAGYTENNEKVRSVRDVKIEAPCASVGKTITATSVKDLNIPAQANDGNFATCWSSEFSDPQSLTIDFVNPKTINEVKLAWESAYAKSYKVQVTNNTAKWTDVYSTTTGVGGNIDVTFPATSARYVRMLGTERATIYGYSLWEMCADNFVAAGVDPKVGEKTKSSQKAQTKFTFISGKDCNFNGGPITEHTQFTVYDIQGKLMKNFYMSPNGTSQERISGIPEGLYFIKAEKVLVK